MRISYAVTVCDEFIEIQRLIPFLLEHKRPQDEIVVQMDLNVDDLKDCPQDKKDVFAYIMKHNTNGALRVIFCSLRGDFAAFKNHLTKQCTGDYIFQIDADELPHQTLIEHLPLILELNPQNEAYWVPRINTVDGITEEHIKQWGWRVNSKGWINWPDAQMRIYKNDPKIYWMKPVHEQIVGHNFYSAFPYEEEYALYHPKTIERQERQNNFYETL